MPIGSLKRDFERDPPNYCLAIGASNMGDPVFDQLLENFALKRFWEAREDLCGSNLGSCVL